MRFGIRDRLFAMAAVGEREADVAQIPLFVRVLLEQLDPHVFKAERGTRNDMGYGSKISL